MKFAVEATIMAWHVRNLDEEREAFVNLTEFGHQCFSRLCKSFGISRKTGHKWCSRYKAAGKICKPLEDQSRRPHNSHAIGEQVRGKVLRLRAQYGWGAPRLAAFLKAAGISIGHTTSIQF
jgi:putative transposase